MSILLYDDYNVNKFLTGLFDSIYPIDGDVSVQLDWFHHRVLALEQENKVLWALLSKKKFEVVN